MISKLEQLQADIEKLHKDRDWSQFHSPKNLAMDLSIEANEVMEIFLWKSTDTSSSLTSSELQHLKEELGDVYIVLLTLAKKFDLSLIDCASEKLKEIAKKYPIAQAKGRNLKYTAYQQA